MVKRDQIEAAAEVIRSGGVVAYPTESCYGLGCDPRQHKAVRRLLRIKRRQWQQGLILIAARVNQILRYIDCEQQLLARANQRWPGPVTWLLPTHPGTSRWITGVHPTIAVRVTAHPGAAALCSQARIALVSTSANRHGHPPAKSSGAVYREFGDELDFVLSGNLGGSERPSEIIDARTHRVVRAS